MRPLTIALDFDDTWTADPEMWLEFAIAARRRGHNVFICTMRGECEENDEEIHGKGVPLDMQIVYAYGLTKSFACRGKGLDVDIWIDDAPFFINGHSPGVTFVEKGVGFAVKALNALSERERREVFDSFCTHCGSDDPGCQCWNDE